MSETSKLQHRTWSKPQYTISTDPSFIPVDKLNAAFASSDVYWALPMPDEMLRETLERSLCFGLYKKPQSQETPSELIGFARCVTDFTTFAYLTDVYVWPEHQGDGLGKWLITCVQEVLESMPFLRRTMLVTSDWERSVPFYRKLMGMEVMGATGKEEGGPAVMQVKGRAFPPNR